MWSSILFQSEKCPGLVTTGPTAPPGVVFGRELWSDLGLMRAYVREQGLADQGGWEVAFAWFSDQAFREPKPYRPYCEPTRPRLPDRRWKFLGFDVGDFSMLSGLTNCGYQGSDHEDAARILPSGVNEHHLITTVADAFAFRTFSDNRVSEHAPFFVYGLWRIPTSSRRRL